MIKLTEYLGSRYLTGDNIYLLGELIKKNPDETIDLAGMHYTIASAMEINHKAANVKFVDTENPSVTQAFEDRRIPTVLLTLQEYATWEEAINEIYNLKLDEATRYSLQYTDSLKLRNEAILLFLSHPQITFVLGPSLDIYVKAMIDLGFTSRPGSTGIISEGGCIKPLRGINSLSCYVGHQVIRPGDGLFNNAFEQLKEPWRDRSLQKYLEV